MRTAHRVHRMLAPKGVEYVIIGGLSVIRNGAVRTTEDIDVLVRRGEWPRIKGLLGDAFRVEGDRAAEYDGELEANFLSLPAILELKTAVYLQKRRDEGIEVAAKDLADVVQLLERNRERLSANALENVHPRIRKELAAIQRRLRHRSRRHR
jgi:hypothetical protein